MSEDDPGEPPNPPSHPAAGDDHKSSEDWQEYLNLLTCSECGAPLDEETLEIRKFLEVEDDARIYLFCNDCSIITEPPTPDPYDPAFMKAVDAFYLVRRDGTLVDERLVSSHLHSGAAVEAPTEGPRRTLKKKYSGFIDKVRKEFADWRRELDEDVCDGDEGGSA